MTGFDNEVDINHALSIKYNVQHILFSISSPFLPILVTSTSIGTVKVIYFLLFSLKQVNRFLNPSANSFMIK